MEDEVGYAWSVFDPQFAAVVSPQRAHRHLSGFDHLLAPPVLDDDDSGIGEGSSEQLGLDVEVLVHGVVEVEMILGEVRETRDREVSPVDPVLAQRM